MPVNPPGVLRREHAVYNPDPNQQDDFPHANLPDTFDNDGSSDDSISSGADFE